MTVDKAVQIRFGKRKDQALLRLKKEAKTLFLAGVTKKEVTENIDAAYADAVAASNP